MIESLICEETYDLSAIQLICEIKNIWRLKRPKLFTSETPKTLTFKNCYVRKTLTGGARKAAWANFSFLLLWVGFSPFSFSVEFILSTLYLPHFQTWWWSCFSSKYIVDLILKLCETWGTKQSQIFVSWDTALTNQTWRNKDTLISSSLKNGENKSPLFLD